TAFVKPFARKLLLHTSSANLSVWCAGVRVTGRISYKVTGTPCEAICQAASLPAKPAPITVTFDVVLNVMTPFRSERRSGQLAAAAPASLCVLLFFRQLFAMAASGT